MELQAGRVLTDGLIIGRFGPGPMTENATDALVEVVAALSSHHQLQLHVWPETKRVAGPLPHGQSSQPALAGINGTVLRVLNGAGRLRVGTRDLNVDYGDWAFIPSGAIYSCTGMVMQGMNLRYATVRLTRR